MPGAGSAGIVATKSRKCVCPDNDFAETPQNGSMENGGESDSSSSYVPLVRIMKWSCGSWFHFRKKQRAQRPGKTSQISICFQSMKSAISSIFRKIKHFAEIRENLLFLAILAIGIVGVIKNTKHDSFSLECEDNPATLECIRPVASKKPLDFAKSI